MVCFKILPNAIHILLGNRYNNSKKYWLNSGAKRIKPTFYIQISDVFNWGAGAVYFDSSAIQLLQTFLPLNPFTLLLSPQKMQVGSYFWSMM